MNLIQKLSKKNLISPPSWLPENTHYLCLMGSYAYGCETKDSDRDVYGFCIPPQAVIFPHLRGEIPGFGRQQQRFDVWQEHHIKSEPEYDVSVYNIVRYFHLCMENNPNMLDSLFVPQHAVLTQTKIGQRVRENRKMFLHAGYWHKAKGFSYSQLHKMDSMDRTNPERQKSIEKYGYDVKFGYHTVRLMLQCEMALLEGDLDLTRHNEVYKSIRRGEWPKEKVLEFFNEKERTLESAYANTSLPYKPDEEKIKALLLECLEMHYSSLSFIPRQEELYMTRISEIVHSWESNKPLA